MPPVPQANTEGPAPSRVLQRVDAACERAILIIVALVVLWGPLAFGGIPSEGFLGIQGLTVLALGIWIVRIWAQRPFRLFYPPVCWMALVFVLYALVRCQRQYVVIEFAARRELIEVLVYASLFFVVINNLHKRESITVITLCLVGLGLALSWQAVFQIATKSSHIWGIERRAQFVGRGGGTYINPDHFAGLMGMAIPLALSYTVLSRFKPMMKVLFAYGAVAMLAGIAVSLSRGGMLATGAMLVVFCLVLLFQRGHWLPALVIMAGLGVAGAVVGTESEALQKRFEGAISNGKLVDPRASYWPVAIHIFEDHPVWGGGPGHFDSEFAKYRPPNVQGRPVYSHNDYLNTLSDWGGVGLTVILAFLALLCYGVFRTWPKPSQPDFESAGVLKSDKGAFLLGASFAILDILFHSVVDFNMHVPANAAIVIILMGLMAAYWRFVTDRFWFDPRWLGKIVLTAAILAAMGWLSIQGVHRGREAYWRHRVENETAPAADRLAALKNAYEAEPSNFANSYNIGEYYRLTSQEGNPGYEELARQAMQWYNKSMVSNPLDAFVPMRYGMCLDWIGQTNEATSWFKKAEEMDPNNTHVAYFMGRHCVELGDNDEAMRWFERSLSIQRTDLAFEAWWLLQVRMKQPDFLFKMPSK